MQERKSNKEFKIFRPNKIKSIFLLLISSVFVFGGYLMLEDKLLEGWFTIVFFGIGIIVSLIQLHPNLTYLKLDKDGFEVKSPFRSNFTKWSEVKNFNKGSIRGNKMILFDYTSEHKKWNTGKKIAQFLSGNQGAILSNYNINTDKLLALMIEYKRASNHNQL